MKVRLFIIVIIWGFLVHNVAFGTEHHLMFKFYQDNDNHISTYMRHDKYKNSATLGSSDIFIVFSSMVDDMAIRFYVANVYNESDGTTCSYNLFRETQLVEYLDLGKNFYYSSEVYKLIWKQILEKYKGIKNIYFIPQGLLSILSIEYLIDSNGRMLCENYNVFRLSSPSVLNEYSIRKSKKNVSIWGGIDFYADLPDFTKYEYADTTSISKCNIGYLEDSYRAAVLINEEIRQQGICSNFYFNNEATEERFKSQKWNNIDVLFIETHGLFLNDYNIIDREDPMENHALALAGASYVLEGGIVPDSIDDGILTAKEISELDLSNVDLAVISACKSALGEIKKDGVYGLTRGLKLAGVKSLIMATDDIVDYVSGQLWIQLFRNLATGMTKREALLQGLKYIRTMDEGAFSHPKYWTPFILIDGLE